MWDFLELVLGGIIDLGSHRSWSRFFMSLGLTMLGFAAIFLLIYLITR